MAKNILISGGAGFIGCNAAQRYALQGARVTIIDQLSRTGSERNLDWINSLKLPNVTFLKADIRDAKSISDVFEKEAFDLVLHLAAQVAVTLSIQDPVYDHAVNTLGTLNMLEGLRKSKNPKAYFVFASTNKVYGGLEDLDISEGDTRYHLTKLPNGIPESRNLDFHSPYGCSKGAADQYTRDYARIYGLNTVVFRQSCIYGPQQVGIEDQGWIAWFVRKALQNASVNVYGTGKQVRDLLFIEDLLEAYDLAEANVEKTKGQIYNMGGGPASAKSVIEVLEIIKKDFPDLNWQFEPWRAGDQKVYISDLSNAERDFGWRPKTSAVEGIARLISWARENQHTLPAIKF
ncbi:GDP-mannose 4,6-dehydratase [soil metagenome]